MLLLDHFLKVNFIKEPYGLQNYQDISLYKFQRVYESIKIFPFARKLQIVFKAGGSNMGNLWRDHPGAVNLRQALYKI